MAEIRQQFGAQMPAQNTLSNQAMCKHCAAQQDLRLLKKRLGHDLRAPLRALKALPDWIRTELEAANACTKPIEQYLLLTESSANRLDTFIKDLMQFLDIGTTERSFEMIDAKSEIESVLSNNGLIDARQTGVSDELRQIACNRSEFLMLVNCIVSNAVKHCGDEAMSLRVNGHMRDTHIVIAFSDQGPGINPKDQARVFEPFETLKPRDQVEGSGLGLAIAAKIMRKWGGTITLQSQPGFGCTFVVSFPVF